jgi:hypothetical protein
MATRGPNNATNDAAAMATGSEYEKNPIKKAEVSLLMAQYGALKRELAAYVVETKVSNNKMMLRAQKRDHSLIPKSE